MKQLKINITPRFERDLERFMKERGITDKSEAIHIAIRELRPKIDFRALLGIGLKGPMNPNPRFKTEDDLWADCD